MLLPWYNYSPISEQSFKWQFNLFYSFGWCDYLSWSHHPGSWMFIRLSYFWVSLVSASWIPLLLCQIVFSAATCLNSTLFEVHSLPLGQFCQSLWFDQWKFSVMSREQKRPRYKSHWLSTIWKYSHRVFSDTWQVGQSSLKTCYNLIESNRNIL